MTSSLNSSGRKALQGWLQLNVSPFIWYTSYSFGIRILPQPDILVSMKIREIHFPPKLNPVTGAKIVRSHWTLIANHSHTQRYCHSSEKCSDNSDFFLKVSSHCKFLNFFWNQWNLWRYDKHKVTGKGLFLFCFSLIGCFDQKTL